MGKAQAMHKSPPGVAPHPLMLIASSLLAGTALYLPTGHLYESLAASAYTLYWCMSMVHNIKTGPPVTHQRARLVYWALTVSVPLLGLAFWIGLTALLALAGHLLGWPVSLWAPQPSYLLGLPFATAASMLYLGRVLEDMAHDEPLAEP